MEFGQFVTYRTGEEGHETLINCVIAESKTSSFKISFIYSHAMQTSTK